ncbi:MAG TPA: hypothetical protein PLY40_07315 [Bacillota bacterium]|nr:hypothetical protein [Bacillota bacterium]
MFYIEMVLNYNMDYRDEAEVGERQRRKRTAACRDVLQITQKKYQNYN